nr:XRE family transcriptional regulator [uncultured Rhodopila sp.]
MSAGLIGSRIRTRREQLGFSQEAVARHFGFNDRQTLSAIETGERRVSAEELLKAAEILNTPLDYFTDPFLLAGEGRFSWRQDGVAKPKLDEYEEVSGRLIAAFRSLGTQLGRKPQLLRHTLGLTKSSTYEAAAEAGERFAAEFELGPVPALRLAGVMEQRLGILVLMVDGIPGVSGAACRLPELDAVLINRREVPGRRHYDLAHELFHILTWDTMPPEHVEDATGPARGRVEQLADAFASALLMPSSVLQADKPWADLDDGALVTRLNQTADALGVTAIAVKWRLVSSGHLAKARARLIDDGKLRHNGRLAARKSGAKRAAGSEADNGSGGSTSKAVGFLGGALLGISGASASADMTPPLFSKPFMELLAQALDEGRISVRRLASLLGLTIDDLEVAFTAHGVAAEVGI